MRGYDSQGHMRFTAHLRDRSDRRTVPETVPEAVWVYLTKVKTRSDIPKTYSTSGATVCIVVLKRESGVTFRPLLFQLIPGKFLLFEKLCIMVV